MEGAEVTVEVPSELERRLAALEHANKPRPVADSPKPRKRRQKASKPPQQEQPVKGSMSDVKAARARGFAIPTGWHHAEQRTRDLAASFLAAL